MECSCNIDAGVGDDGYEEIAQYMKYSKSKHKCGECGKTIKPGEKYEYYKGRFDGEFHIHKTCIDCLSLREHFFGDWIFESTWEMFQEHMDECFWQVPEKCLAKVTSNTRAKICEMIEEYWMENEEDEEA